MATTTAEAYEIPVVSLLSHTTASSEHQEANNTSLYQDVSQPYEVPCTTASKHNQKEKHTCHILEATTTLTEVNIIIIATITQICF